MCLLSCFGCVWLCDATDCSPPGSSVHGILQARILEWVAFPFFRGSFQARDWTQIFLPGRYHLSYQSQSVSRSVVSDSFWPHGQYTPWNSPGQNTMVGRLSLLQGIFPTQESNRGLLHCRWFFTSWAIKEAPLSPQGNFKLSKGEKGPASKHVPVSTVWRLPSS